MHVLPSDIVEKLKNYFKFVVQKTIFPIYSEHFADNQIELCKGTDDSDKITFGKFFLRWIPLGEVWSRVLRAIRDRFPFDIQEQCHCALVVVRGLDNCCLQLKECVCCWMFLPESELEVCVFLLLFVVFFVRLFFPALFLKYLGAWLACVSLVSFPGLGIIITFPFFNWFGK